MTVAISYFWQMPADLGTNTLPAANAQSPTSGRIAFVSNRDGNDEIYVMNADGSNVLRLTHDPGKDWVPRWSPDGRQIAFFSNRDDNDEIYVMNADGTNLLRLTHTLASDWTPSWSSDGRQIAFSSSRDGDFEIYLMNADGSQLTQLTHNQSHDWSPSWSPDGQRIAFMSDVDGNNEIYVMDADGSRATRLTHNPNSDSRPSWSPDSSKILFTSDRHGNVDIYMMDPDGAEQTRLTWNEAADRTPTWSPYSSRIAFSSTRDGNRDIFVMNPDGTGINNLSNHTASDGAPDWGPISGTSGSHPTPLLVVTPSAYNFGRVTQGDTPEIVLSITNAGMGVLHSGYRSVPDWVEIGPTDLSETGEGTILLRMRSDAPLGSLAGALELAGNGGELSVALRAEVVPSPKPDLVVYRPQADSDELPTQFTVGDRFSMVALVTNIGASAAGTSGISYQIGEPSDWSSWKIDTLVRLRPSQTFQTLVRYTFTEKDVGTRYFRLVADHASEVDETDESNNVAMIGPFQVVPAPESAPTPTDSPTPTSAPTPASAPTAKPVPTNTPTPTLGPDGPIATLHAESNEAVTGQEVNVSLTVRNVASIPYMTIDVIVEAPQGLLLAGESCPSSGQCSSTSHLTGDDGTEQMELTAIAHKAGTYTLEATLSWSTPSGVTATITRPLDLTFTDSIVVDLHTDRTEVVVGEPVVLTFEANNAIASPVATGRLSLTRPSGWSVSEAEFADSCGASCVGNLSIPSGQSRSIVVKMVPNQPGTFSIEAKLEWILQDDSNRTGMAADSVDIAVAATGAQPSETGVAASLSTAGQQPEDSGPPSGPGQASPWWLSPLALVALALLVIVVIVAIGFLAIVRSIRAARHEPPVFHYEEDDFPPGLQGQSGFGGSEGPGDDGPAGRPVRGSPGPD